MLWVLRAVTPARSCDVRARQSHRRAGRNASGGALAAICSISSISIENDTYTGAMLHPSSMPCASSQAVNASSRSLASRGDRAGVEVARSRYSRAHPVSRSHWSGSIPDCANSMVDSCQRSRDSPSWPAARCAAAAGLLSSWARPAESLPRAAIFSVCRSSSSTRRPPFGDVDEGDDAPDQLALLRHRMGPVLDRERPAVLAEHHLVVDVRAPVVPECLIDAARLQRVGITVGAGVVHEIVHLLAQELVHAVESQQLGARRIGERAPPLEVDSVYPLARGIQEETHELVGLAQRLFRLALLRDVRPEDEDQIGPGFAGVGEEVMAAVDTAFE